MSRKIAFCSMLVAISMIFSYVEVIIPINFGIPGVKLGLANIVIVIGLYIMDVKEVFLITMMRVLLVGMLFGNGISVIYSLTGAVFSFAGMALLKKNTNISMTLLSVAGGVLHNLGQLIIAFWIIRSSIIFYYFGVLTVSGVVTGLIIGTVSKRILKLVKQSYKV
ncbi:MAG: Gx transporter family protein [Suipraeoptans sp.]